MLASLAIATFLAAATAALSLVRYAKSQKSGPCSATNSADPLQTPFVLPKSDYTCPKNAPRYDLVFFSPVNNPLSNSNLVFTGPVGVNNFFTPSRRGDIIQQDKPGEKTPAFQFIYGNKNRGVLMTQYTTMQARSQTSISAIPNLSLYLTSPLPTGLNAAAGTAGTASTATAGTTSLKAINSTNDPLNMCPQSFVENANVTTGVASQFAAAPFDKI